MNAVRADRPRTRQGNRAGRACVVELKSASISSEFGMKMLRAKFIDADEILARLGVYSKGPRKGQPRGMVTWRKVSEGGFNYKTRRVELPGCTDWDAINDAGKSIAAEIHFERVAAQRVKEDAERAERLAALEAMSPADKALHYARKAREAAHVALRDAARSNDRWYLEEFRDRIRRARDLVQVAREARKVQA